MNGAYDNAYHHHAPVHGAHHGLQPDQDVQETLHRGLKARQLTMIALGATIGTGLIVGSGTGLRQGGPLGLLLGYTSMGFVCYSILGSLGEMAAFLPHKRGISGYVTRFWHPAYGFAVGWNYLIKYWMICPIQINMAGITLTTFAQSIPIAAWMVVVIFLVTLVNAIPVRYYGELEFWLSTGKITALIGLIMFGIVYNAGGAELSDGTHDYVGFRYWGPGEGPFGSFDTGNVHFSRFLVFCYVLVNALFAYSGTEMIGVAAAEALNPRKDIPSAVKRIFWIIFPLYIIGIFIIGLIVPSHPSTEELQAIEYFVSDAEVKGQISISPFVAAVAQLGNQGLRHTFNAIVLVFAFSAASTDLYISSRTLFALAIEGKAPRLFKVVTPWGVPINALLVSVAFSFLAYLNATLSVSEVFERFVRLSTTFAALTWICISYTHIRFMAALKAQGKSRDKLPWKAPLQPFGAYFAFCLVSLLLILKGFDSLKPFSASKFVISYIGIVIFFCFFLLWRWKTDTHTIDLVRVDFETDLETFDQEQREFEEQEEEKKLQRIEMERAQNQIGSGRISLWQRISGLTNKRNRRTLYQ